MKRLFREPLLHFLLLGAAFFVAYRLARRAGAGEGSRIVVTSGEIEHLAAGFAQTWQRPPTRAELAGLVRDRVREEVYCREAIALGLDKDDSVIRRRLLQKMEFVTSDAATRAEPTDAELEVFLRRHPESFRIEPRFTFRQVYLEPKLHAADAGPLLARLSRIGDRDEAAALGDATLLDAAYSGIPASEVARTFGDAFAAALAKATPGRWEGPIASG
ncbi:MAG TPA: peptidyl-prolyl cis-trans isomerase, partial [Thermoanaerobaculia bacterium]|nr:peptidyl-prolyl cis-trans isomerase [Thermoanaerobaculia bacterium]